MPSVFDSMNNTAEAKLVRPPLGVVLISAYYFLTSAYTLISFTAARSGLVKSGPARLYASMALPNSALLLLSGCLTLSAAIFLLLLRRPALPLFCAALALDVSVTLRDWNLLWLMGAGVAIRITVPLAVMLLVCIYVAWLRTKGILR